MDLLTDKMASTFSTVYLQPDKIDIACGISTADGKHDTSKIPPTERCIQELSPPKFKQIIMQMCGKSERYMRQHSEMRVFPTGKNTLRNVNSTTNSIPTKMLFTKSNFISCSEPFKQLDAIFEEPRAMMFVNRCRTNSWDVTLHDHQTSESRSLRLSRNSIPVRDLFRSEIPVERFQKILKRMKDLEKLTYF